MSYIPPNIYQNQPVPLIGNMAYAHPSMQGQYLNQPAAYPIYTQQNLEQKLGNSNNFTNIPSLYTLPIQTLSQPPLDSPEATWTTVVNSKKRNRGSPDNRSVKQTKISDYWLNSPVATTNRFAQLDNEDASIGNEKNYHEMGSSESEINTTIKTPPIFVKGVKNISPLIDLLTNVVNNNYELKVLNFDQVKIQPKTSEAYSIITKALEGKQTQFYTYRLKEMRSFRVVLKNIHYSVNLEDLRTEIEDQGHTVENIWNIKHRQTKDPLPMFFVDIKPKENNKEIYNIEYLMKQKVKVEPPRQKREIPQCARCQRYGHTKSYCRLNPRCVKCTGNHATDKCSRTTRSDSVKCILCEGNHPANYKGCSVYQELLRKKYPPLRPKKQTAVQEVRTVQPELSYAQVTNGPQQHAAPSNDIAELKAMMKTLTEQISTMLNLLTSVVAKLTK